jgi:ribosomal protein S3AE
MSEIPAKQARDITNNKDEWNTEKWYSIWKDKFFEEIKKEALRGNNSIVIESDEWESSEHNKRYLITKLNSLGYKTNVSVNDLNHEEVMLISW